MDYLGIDEPQFLPLVIDWKIIHRLSKMVLDFVECSKPIMPTPCAVFSVSWLLKNFFHMPSKKLGFTTQDLILSLSAFVDNCEHMEYGTKPCYKGVLNTLEAQSSMMIGRSRL